MATHPDKSTADLVRSRLARLTSRLRHWSVNRDAILADELLKGNIKFLGKDYPACAQCEITLTGERFWL